MADGYRGNIERKVCLWFLHPVSNIIGAWGNGIDEDRLHETRSKIGERDKRNRLAGFSIRLERSAIVISIKSRCPKVDISLYMFWQFVSFHQIDITKIFSFNVASYHFTFRAKWNLVWISALNGFCICMEFDGWGVIVCVKFNYYLLSFGD